MATVIVTGGRHFDDRGAVYQFLNEVHRAIGITLLRQGGAKGADELAREWADEADVDFETFEADWEKWGNAAGPIRNQEMLDAGDVDLVLAFPGGRGTADMVAKAKRAGISTIVMSKGATRS